MAECADAVFDLAGDEFRDVIGFHEAKIVVGIGLGQEERFGHLALRIHIGKEGTGVKSIQPTAAEHDPTAVAAPRVIALHIIAIDCDERNRCFRLQIRQIEIGVLVPNGEIAIPGERIEQPAPIGRNPRERGT